VGKVSHGDTMHAIAALQAYVKALLWFMLIQVVVCCVCGFAAFTMCRVKVHFASEKKSKEPRPEKIKCQRSRLKILR
jgi:uncharacterized protein (DUF2225 family)